MKKIREESEFPTDGDVFYWVRSDTGDICESRWCSNSQSCLFRRSIGNIFKSRGDALAAKMRQCSRQINIEEILK